MQIECARTNFAKLRGAHGERQAARGALHTCAVHSSRREKKGGTRRRKTKKTLTAEKQGAIVRPCGSSWVVVVQTGEANLFSSSTPPCT